MSWRSPTSGSSPFPTRRAPRRTARWAAALLAAVLAGLAPGSARASVFRTILVDGDLSDWGSIAPLHVDPAGDDRGAAVDLGRIAIANDSAFVYLRFEIGRLLNLQALPEPLRIYFDTDASIATGYPIQGIGSDLLVECSYGGSGLHFFEQTPGNPHAHEVSHGLLDAYQGPTVAATEFELRLRRDAWMPFVGRRAFPGPEFRVVFEALAGGRPVETAPDFPDAITYAFASGVQDPPPDNDLLRHDPRHVRILTYNVRFDGLVGPDSLSFRRILTAIGPDVIGFQELFDTAPGVVAARLDRDLPLPGGARWQAFKGERGQVTASRYPMTRDPGAPFRELATLIDLPDSEYVTDLYVINSHFKCCGSIGTSEDAQRQAAADAIVAWIRDLQTPGGASLPNFTPIVHLGDLNLVGGPQPLETLLTGDIVDEATYGEDYPPDWDATALSRARPIHTDGHAAYTWRNDASAFAPGKLDYVIYTDAVASSGNQFVLNTFDMSAAKLASLGLFQHDTERASDHLPTVLDLMPGEGAVNQVVSHPDVVLSARGYPNPFAGTAHIRFELAAPAEVGVCVHDVTGHRVRQLARRVHAAGVHTATWDGRDERGRPVESGLYLVHFTVGRGDQVRSGRAVKVTMFR